MKKHSVFKKLLVVFVVIIFAFAAINLGWFFGVKNEYIRQTENMDKVWDNISERWQYEKETAGYSCVLKMPTYLTNNGFLSVSPDPNVSQSEAAQTSVTLFIWPKGLGRFKYGVILFDFTNMNQIYINSDGSYIPSEDGNIELDQRNAALIEENREKINGLLEIANDVWSFD